MKKKELRTFVRKGVKMYATDTEAQAYFADTLNEATWLAIDSARRDLLLETASQYIDNTFTFPGTQTDEIKAFPRSECVNRCTGSTYEDDEVPQAVKNATCEIALEMDSNSELSTGKLNSADYNIVREKVDSLEVEYREKPSESFGSKPYGYTWLRCILTSDNLGMVSARIVKG